MKPEIKDGKVVALVSIDPPGAVRVVGAAVWLPAWRDRIPEGEAREAYDDANAFQSETSPRDSPLNPLVVNVADQITTANKGATPPTDTTTTPTDEAPPPMDAPP